MANDRFMQAWFNLDDTDYLEAASVSQFNVAGDFVTSVLFKIPGTAFPGSGGDFSGFLPSAGFSMLWSNLEVVGANPYNALNKGWAIALGQSPGNDSLAVLAWIGGMTIPAGQCVLAGDDPSLSYGHELADRLILVSMHYYVSGQQPTVDIYVNGNRVTTLNGQDVPAYTASAVAPRVGACANYPNSFAKGIEIAGTSFSGVETGLSNIMPALMAEYFRATRQNNKLGNFAPTLTPAHSYNASGSPQNAAGVKLVRVVNPQGIPTNTLTPVFAYTAQPAALAVPDTGNQGAVELPGVTAVPLNVTGTVYVRTTQNPNWYTQVSPFVEGLA